MTTSCEVDENGLQGTKGNCVGWQVPCLNWVLITEVNAVVKVGAET